MPLKSTREAIGVDANNSYLPFWGQEALRKAVVNNITRSNGISYDWKSQCVITAGGCAGMLNSLLALLDQGDEVILTDPLYAGLINRVRLAGGVPRFVPLIPSSQGWRLDLAALKKAVSPKTRVVLMMSPSMPTGHVLNEEEWHAVAEVCKKADAWLLYDAAMERILFDNRSVLHPAALPGMQERTIIVGSVSKEYRMIGWRIGWVVGPQDIINDIGLVGISNVVCQVGIAMPGATAALTAKDDGLQEAVHIWEERRNVLLQELEGLPVVPPHGGWSMLLDTSALGYPSKDASDILFKEAKIAATPMVGWGEHAHKYLRIVFSNEPKERLRGIGKKVRTALKLSH